MDYHEYKNCIEACLNCASVCDHCASSCTREPDVTMMARCIRLDMECSAICYAAAQLMSLGSPQTKAICKLCADICRRCAEECSKHNNEHCHECAESCRLCAEACESMQ